MARLQRVSPKDVPVHVIQRGNNRQVCFVAVEDYGAYLDWLTDYSKRYSVEIHSWVLMTNHIHLLCTPRRPEALSRMMQSLGRSYVRYFNFKYKRTGTLWEGRFKSCLIQSEIYLLEVYQYIELNPVRAGMVTDPGEYKWSSHKANALGQSSELRIPHQEYLALGRTSEERRSNYLALFSQHIDKALLSAIRASTNKGLALGNDHFVEEIEVLTGRRVKAIKRGRPKGWRKKVT